MESMLRISVRESGAVKVVSFNDRKILDATGIEELGGELLSLSAIPGVHLVLNFQGVEFMSSAALQKFILLSRKVMKARGKLIFCNMRNEVYQVLSLTNLNRTFVIIPTLEEAIEFLPAVDYEEEGDVAILIFSWHDYVHSVHADVVGRMLLGVAQGGRGMKVIVDFSLVKVINPVLWHVFAKMNEFMPRKKVRLAFHGVNPELQGIGAILHVVPDRQAAFAYVHAV